MKPPGSKAGFFMTFLFEVWRNYSSGWNFIVPSKPEQYESRMGEYAKGKVRGVRQS